MTSATANDIQITEKTNPKIVELYNQLQEKQNQISELETERGDALQKNLDAMRENEQRLENRMLGATTTLATGLGGMTAAAGLAETRADADALNAMRAYLATFRCDYGGGRVVDYGPNDVDLPGGNELIEYTNEYKSLAENLKKTKAALGLVPGIESETILSRAETGLYDNVSTGKTTGAYASLARGILDPDGADAAEIAQQQSETAEKLKVGAVALGAGVIGGAIENYRLNKDAPKEQSEQINAEYDSKVETLTQEQESIEKDLDNAIAENARAVQEYNKNVAEHRKNIDEIERAPADCRNLFGEYIAAVAGLELIENEMDSVPDVTLPEMDSDLLAKCTQCKNKDAIFYAETKTCECPDDRPIEKDGKCVEKPVEVAPMVSDPETPVYDKIVPEEKEEKDDPADYCPAKGNALKSITDKNKVGDSCTSDIISQGTITKRKNGKCTCDATGCWSPYTPNKSGQCVKQQSGGASSGPKKTNEFVDENGYCKPYKIKEWFFNKEQSADISKKFQKLCDDAAKAHNCKRKDLNTSRLIEKDDSGAVQYEWTCNADSEDYLATQERINQRHANLSYENVCKKLKPGTTNQEGQIKRGCFGIFENIDIPDYKTQLELAKARIGTSSACSDKREIRRNTSTNNPIGYYTNCNTTNDKERYTFIFTGISSGNTTPENLMRAACATYGVKFGGQGGELGRKQPYCSYTYKSVDKDPTCNKIDALAQKFGYTARIVRGTGCVLDTTGGIGGNQLTQSGMRSDEKIRNLKTAFGIDNSLFANISTNMDEWLYDQMKTIVANEMVRAGHSDPLVSFECFPTKSFALDKGVEAKLFRDVRGRNVLTCRANGHDIDFIFHNLGHVTKRRANASQEGLTCIFGSDGKYDGRQCWGITEQDCTKLDKAIKEHAKTCSQCGAKWLPKAGDTDGFCSLTKSTKVEKTNKGLEIAGNIALIAGGAVLTVMSGGMAMPMLVTEIALMGVELTGATVAAVEEKHMRNVANEFLAKTQYCHDAECAQKLLTDKDVHRILNLESNLDERQSKIIDDKLSELLGVVPSDAPLYVALLAGMENKPNCNFWRNATAQCEWAQFWHTWANVAQFASLGAALGRSAVRFVNAKLAIEKAATTLAREITPAQAKKIGELDKKIAVLESKANRTSKEAAELKKLHQERNTLLNKIGTKDADEVARLQKAALDKKAIEDAQAEYRSALKKRNEMADYMAKHNGNPPQGKTRFDVKDINDEVAKAEKKLKDLGQEVTPAEPLQIGKKPTTTPEPKPVEPTTTPKEPETTTPKTEEPATPKPAEVEAKPTAVPATPQSAVRAKLGDKVNADIEGIKSGKTKELHIPKGQLTDDEWKILKDDLAKDGLEIREAPGNMYYTIKKADNVDDVARVAPGMDDATRGTGEASGADDVARGADIHGGFANDAERMLGNLGFSEWDNGVFHAKYDESIERMLRSRNDIKWIVWKANPESALNENKILIAISNDVAAKQGLRWSDSANDFVRSFNSQKSAFGRSKLDSFISSRKSLTEINGTPVRIKEFGANSGVPIVKVEIAGREITFYQGTGSVASNDWPGHWYCLGGINNGQLYLPRFSTPKEITVIEEALNSQIGDIRNVEHVLKSQAHWAMGRPDSFALIDNAPNMSAQTINRGLHFNNTDDFADFNKILKDRPTPASSTGATAGRGVTSGSNTAATGGKKVGTSATSAKSGADDAMRSATNTVNTTTVGEIATKDSGTIIRESRNLSPNQQQELYSKLTDAQRKSIAQMKVNAGEVKLPFGATADDLAKNPDLLTLSGEYLPLNQTALAKVSESPTLSRYNQLINKKTLTSAEKAELEQLRNSVQPELRELRHMLSNDVSVDNIIANGTQYKEKLIGIISSDPQLTRQAQNFDKLSKTQKENFLNRIADELNTSFSGGDPRLKPKVDVKYIDSWAEVEGISKERIPEMNLKQPGASQHHLDGSSTIYILNTYPNNLGYGSKLDDTMSLFAHEHGHAMDDFAADKVATGGSSMFEKMVSLSRANKKTPEAFAEYIFEPTELSSRGINEVVGTNFTKDLNNAIETGTLTTSSLSDVQKIRIQSGYTGAKSNFVLSPKQTNELGIDYYKFTPSAERTGSLQPIVDNIKERGIEHVAIIKEDGKDVVAIFDNADDYAVAMRKVNASGGADDAMRGTTDLQNTRNTTITQSMVDDILVRNDDIADMSKMGKAGKWADATVLDPTFDIKVTPLELGGKKYYLKAGDTETLIQNEISRTKQAHELLKHNKIVTSVGVVEDDQTVLKAFMDTHPDITLPRTPDTQYFIMEATHANTVEGLSDAEILGYLRNKPITIEEQNTILSEIQNMNNNGLIHNDIWHNFAIYRDSGGKLHMELMDFGDFTAEDKLLRSNDDVLEIKKLFSKWSDRGLVERGGAKKADNISVATSSVSATKADDVVAISATQAKASNVATLRQSASKSFDKYLAEVKTSPTGKGAKLPKSRLNDAGWDLVNESLARENVQLVDVVQDGEHYMQFRRADAVDDVTDATRARASTTTKANDVDEVIELQLDDMFDAHNLRVSDGSGRLYVRNSAQEMLGFPVSGEDAVSEVGQLYNTIRRGIEYPVNDTKVSRAINAMQNPTSTGVVYRAPTDRYPWHVHSYNGARSSAQYHVSLNVEVDDTLIKKLDEIIAKDRGQHIIDFKIPPKGSRWKTMADPISIYMHETSPEIERAIAEAARPYVRTSSEIGLLGRKIDDGVAIAFETSDARMDIVENIINQVARKDINVANALRREGRYSVGNTEALRVWASDFLGYEIKPVVP